MRLIRAAIVYAFFERRVIVVTGFVFGLIVGGFFGILIVSLCSAAKRGDK